MSNLNQKFLKIFIVLAVCLIFLNAKNTNEKIKEQSSKIEQNVGSQQQINKKLEDLANDILQARKNIETLNKQIDIASQKVQNLQQDSQNQSKALKELSEQNKELIQNKKELETKIIRLISDEFAYDLLADKNYLESSQSIIKTYVLEGLNSVLKNEFYNISKNYESTNAQINQKQAKINEIKNNLSEYQNKQLELNRLKSKQLDILKEQEKNQNLYKKRLIALQNQQDELRKTLSELKILSQKEARIEEAKKRATQQQAQSQNTTPSDDDVKKLGSSYAVSSTTHFNGKKTIAPLKSYSVKQKFGSFTDPVYHIKIYNENVILKSNEKNAQVRAVLNGKVVFAKQTAVLGKVVILEHNDDLHTIYANLIDIPKGVKVGARVKKGNVIGRIDEELAFEVTKKNAHINPLELIF